MNAALSLVSSLALVTSSLPVSAQEQAETLRPLDLRNSATTAGPLARAVTAEAVLPAATGEPTTSITEDVEQSGPSGGSDWSRILDLAPGTEIIVIVIGARPATRYLIARNESELTLLNVTDATLPVATRDELRDVASHHPEYFAAAQRGQTFNLGKSLRLGPDGVFAADTKVVDLTQVVEQVARSEVVEIATAERTRSWVGCGFVGYGGSWIGGAAGGVTGAYLSRSWGGLIVGMVAGGITGFALVYHKCRHKPEKVIYRTP